MNRSPGPHGPPGDDPLAGGPPGEPATPRRRRRRWLRRLALALALALLLVAGIGWVLYEQLNNNITTDTETAEELARWEKQRPSALVAGAQNILIIGSDTRSGSGNGKYGGDSGTQRSDTTILLHVAADRNSATAVSLPRDLMAKIPSCRKPDGTYTNERFAQFNWAYELAGTACTIRTVEGITNIRIDHHIVLDFIGFKRLVDAVDGVEVCLRKPMDDREAHLRLPAGRQVLHGEAALGYVRARYSLGGGSDTERMGRQQEFLGALFREMRSDGILLNPTRLYPVLDAATRSLTTDSGLDSLRKMYDLVRTVRNIPTDRVQFLTAPRKPYAYNANRDELVQPDADQLFEQLRRDRPVSVSAHVRPADGKPGGGPRRDPDPEEPESTELPSDPFAQPSAPPPPASSSAPSPAPSPRPTTPPTYQGTTAAHGICG
ncbi:LCP family protein [Streptomyces cinnamoneus]|uniref:LCP family protein n=1 Tax=Streptomyces cinnamoneus TaxID=53446 RepID=UPI001EFE272A|nr:LCP family protein [Streptomyces cinnamoneus]